MFQVKADPSSQQLPGVSWGDEISIRKTIREQPVLNDVVQGSQGLSASKGKVEPELLGKQREQSEPAAQMASQEPGDFSYLLV